ncbi:class III extradiol ring-cleavage dioxygenase [Tsukamurella sp. 8F]|uniref:dioxygenase family protein n=1 Tax=unclassified Tsukamurella TaxID=2633480 RepID=UPI0023B9970C|nr:MULTISPECIES: class III extradiol ring-cleavage dioxygenase [unclassified Tsukamurella]MDF0532479.1 class III extradiol ring-cleavage dioxygenase [Tsukamurella sp. 8J]MDF0589320.1 class III extradiol ring-cleavage dioxygenase [Tsukamurella sp. 8F]
MTSMPVLYLSHGAPPLLDDAMWVGQLRRWGAELPRPRAILIVSAHWEAAPLRLSSTTPHTPLVYDFWGFPDRFYRQTYDAPVAADVADAVAGLAAGQHPVRSQRGLDHGAYIPLSVMFPDADVPVLQMSLPTLDPQSLLDLGSRLRPLRESGVLVIGSGFTTHGLPFLTDPSPGAVPPGWSVDFDAWARDALSRGDVEQLLGFQTAAPGMPYAHPTVEHFAPLFVALGASSDPEQVPEQVIDGFWMGLAKRSVQLA